MRYVTAANTKNNKILWLMVIAITCLITAGTIGVFLNNKKQHDQVTHTVVSKLQNEFKLLSKAEIQNQVDQLLKQITSLEKKFGYTDIKGYKVYSAKETGVLLHLYHAIDLRLHFLNYGNCNFNLQQWDGNHFNQTRVNPYHSEQANQILSEVARNVPVSLLRQLKIFLLPCSIKDIAGLGGPGYDLISAYPASESSVQAEADLKVTLVHEIGHHIHLSFMPENTGRGQALWNQYLKICGGTWHGPGEVNTKAWSDSSEETFAEYFRMVFGGKAQPFFGDITLGDPRTNPQKVKKLVQFINNLGSEKSVTKYKSPWLPDDGLYFWGIQNQLIAVLWLFLGTGIVASIRLRPHHKETVTLSM